MKVLFVCTGNTCRSPMCEGYFRKLCKDSGMDWVEAASAGISAYIGEPASRQAEETLSRMGVDISGHRSSPADTAALESADMVLAMTSGHKAMVEAICPSAAGKTALLMDCAGHHGEEVADPFGGSVEDYMSCFRQMKAALDALASKLKENRG